MIRKTLGGDRLGAGNKQKVDMHGFERSTHDLSKIWRSTMSVGTLVPFMHLPALPGDTFDIKLEAEVMTHPTLGPLFGSMKVQLDVFEAPIRLYIGALHNNKLKIGMNMASVKLPVITVYTGTRAEVMADAALYGIDNAQINPSSILHYLGIKGIGMPSATAIGQQYRYFNGIPLLAYWEIYKNYYANKQEEIGYVIHGQPATGPKTVTSITINTTPLPTYAYNGYEIEVNYSGATPDVNGIILITINGNIVLGEAAPVFSDSGTQLLCRWERIDSQDILSWAYADAVPSVGPQLTEFPLDTIDEMRERILQQTLTTSPFLINSWAAFNSPYSRLLESNTTGNQQKNYLNTQEGLGIKTYQSDLYNAWLNTEWIDGAGGISEITAVQITSGTFKIDQLNLAEKVYDYLNRVAVSGGSYDDWLEVTYDHKAYTRAESPIYHGGLSKELIFQEVVSTGQNTGALGSGPLGTLAGRGVLSSKHKGGTIIIKVQEPSYLIGIASITPRTDYSQGNTWDNDIQTMDDFHKPSLDEIGFQELITDRMAWFDTNQGAGSNDWIFKSAGKQPAWINYMTAVNETHGNFAIVNNEMFMTLNRRYEYDATGTQIKDLTTYIDPVKYNFIFAETSLDAQNYWVQIGMKITARRKMSAKIMPNL